VPRSHEAPRRATAQLSARSTASVSRAHLLQARHGNIGTSQLVERVAAGRTVQRSAGGAAPALAGFTRISSPHDRAEIEATETARQVMRMSALLPVSQPASQAGAPVQRSVHSVAASQASGASAAPIATAGGAPLPADIRSFMEPRFGADLSTVRIHTGEEAARQSQALDAHAFTVGSHIFFGRNQYQPDSAGGRELIAHELTHTIQQGQVIQRSAPVSVTAHDGTFVQRAGGIRGWLADKANAIPGFRMFTIVLGVNPISMEPVERSAANVLRAVVEFIPGGVLITQALETHGVFERAGAWITQKIATLGFVAGAIRGAFDRFVDTLGASDLIPTHWGDVWARAKRIFSEPIDRLTSFIGGLAGEIVQFIRTAILLPLAALAKDTRGYDLLQAVLGQDPITGAPVARTPERLIGGFMKLIGEEEVWQNIQKANAIPRCWAWFQGAVHGLMGFVRQIPGRLLEAIKSLEVSDMILLPKALVKIAVAFAGFIGEFLKWAGETMWHLLEIVFEVVAPRAIPYLKKAAGAFRSILRNPIGFAGNLIRAAKFGFMNFAANIGQHLKNSLLEWLTGSLPGIYIPQKLELGEVVKFALSVLGISWANIRAKLVKAVGEPAVKAMEVGFDIVVTLVREGPAAAWDKIKEQLANLKDMVIQGITDFVEQTIVKKAVAKIVSLLVPGGAFIQAIVSIYDTIVVFIDKLQKIIEVATAFLDSMMAIASGAIEGAAKKVESTLAGLLTLAISFLAGFLGLGKIADKVMEILNTKVRPTIDKALDFLVNWIVGAAKSLFGKAKAAAESALDWWKKPKPFQTESGHKHELSFGGEPPHVAAMVASDTKVGLDDKLAEFKKQASESTATEAQKKTAPLIDATRATARKDLNDPNLLINLQQLFQVYGETGAIKEMKLTRQTGSLGGDTVALSMTVDWLGPKHPEGSAPESGEQEKLMNLLVTDPSQSSSKKFVRGHLLNENMGGRGNAENMFPITGYANSQHLHSTEKKVKDWLNKPDRWVYYEVKVTNVSSRLDAGPKSPQNYVQCTLACHAILKDVTGKAEEDFSTSVPSTYEAKEKATKIDNLAAVA
jgi:hypothetical protein